MPFIEAPDVVQVEVRYSCLGEDVENTLYFLSGTPVTLTNMAVLAEEIWEALVAEAPAIWHNQCFMRELYLTDLTQENSWVLTYTGTTAVVGTDGGTPVPNNVSWAIGFRTGLAGRSFRGRNYTAGLTLNFTSGNFVTSTYAQNVQDLYELIAANALAVDFQHVVLSRYANGAPRLTALWTPVTSYNISNTALDSQRRRLAGRGD